MPKKPVKKSLLALSVFMCLFLTSVIESTFAFHLTNLDKNAQDAKRPKKLIWGASSKGLQLAVWVSPVRPIVFGLIRNVSQRKIYYCDCLVGQAVSLYVRQSPGSDWAEVPELPVEHRVYIGALRCGSNDTLYPGEKMKASPTAFSRNRVKGNHTFEVRLEDYKFPDDWQGNYEFKIVQRIFGGRHKDAYEGDIESVSFTVRLFYAGAHEVRWVLTGIEKNNPFWFAVHVGSAKDMKYNP